MDPKLSTTAGHGDSGETTDPANPNNNNLLISEDISSLQDLALKGSWSTILEKVNTARSLSLIRFPHEHLIFLTFNVIALTKLRRFNDAIDDINSSIDSVDNPSLRYETYPRVYPNRHGSMVPFSLRWINAVLPSLIRSPDSIDRLYLLLNFVRSRNETSSSEIWKRREKLVMGTLISHHSNLKEFDVSLSLIKEMIIKDKTDFNLFSKLGYIQLQYGDVEGAKSSFNQAEKLIVEKSDYNVIGRNKALIYLVAKDYISAVREYDNCIERDGCDFVAINNKALCLMYLRDLSDSIKVLENSLERVPTVAINETLIVNLCSMYELAYVNHSERKKTLSTFIARVAPDDFDSSCTRI